MFYLNNSYLQFTEALDIHRKKSVQGYLIFLSPQILLQSKNFGWTLDYLGSIKKSV